MKNTTALLLAGGINIGFSVLTHNRAKSALPFCGHFRVIDFALTNLSRSGINNVGILIQYLPGSLIDHVGVGAAWDYATTNRRMKLMPPFVGMGKTEWFRGSADAIYQNLNYILDTGAEKVLVLSADHVYSMDYAPLIAYHTYHNADLTIATAQRPADTPPEAFGYVTSDEKGRVTQFVEKPAACVHNTISTGIYLFNADVLISMLRNLSNRSEKHDLPNSVIAPLVQQGRVFSFPMESNWEYMPDLKAYVRYHQRLLRGEIHLHSSVITNLHDRDLGSRPAPFFGRLSHVEDSLISPGCIIEGTVIRSVLSPGVWIAPGTHVEDCIMFHDCRVEEGVRLYAVISDKDVAFHPFCRVGEPGFDARHPDLRQMVLVGKRAQIAPGVHIGAGKEIPIGQTIKHDWETNSNNAVSTVA